MANGEAIQKAPTAPKSIETIRADDPLGAKWRLAQGFAKSDLVPKDLRGKPENCFVALMMAERMQEDPLMVMQNIVIIHGTPGWKATFLIARANRSGTFRDPIQFRADGKGAKMEVTAFAQMKRTGLEVSATATMEMATTEGWGAGGKKYQSMPQQMLSYRAASMLVRLYCPEVMLGMPTAEEIEIPSSPRMVAGEVGSTIGLLSDAPREVVDIETGEVTQVPTTHTRTREPGEDDGE
jgi:RecT family protein